MHKDATAGVAKIEEEDEVVVESEGNVILPLGGGLAFQKPPPPSSHQQSSSIPTAVLMRLADNRKRKRPSITMYPVDGCTCPQASSMNHPKAAATSSKKKRRIDFINVALPYNKKARTEKTDGFNANLSSSPDQPTIESIESIESTSQQRHQIWNIDPSLQLKSRVMHCLHMFSVTSLTLVHPALLDEGNVAWFLGLDRSTVEASPFSLNLTMALCLGT